jgi:hypothetical protein
MAGPPGPGHATTGHREPGHDKARPRPGEAGDRRRHRRERPGRWAGGPGDARARRHGGSPGGAGALGLPHRRPGAGRGARRLAGGGRHRAGVVRAKEAWPCSSPRCKARWPPARRPAGSSMTPADRAARSCWLRPSPPPGHSPCWAGPARPSALRRQARQIRPARGAGKRRHRRQARPMEQGKTPNEHAEICRPRPYRGRC